MATGHYDQDGFWHYGEDDLADEGAGFSEVLNKSTRAIPAAVHSRVVTELNADATIRDAAAAAMDGALDQSARVPAVVDDEDVAWAATDEAGHRGWAQVRRSDGRATGPTRRYLRAVVASDLAVYADSIMWNAEKGVSIPRTLAGRLGVGLFMPTAYGWGSLEAGIAAGAIRPRVHFPGNVLPAASVEVPVTLDWAVGGWSEWRDVDMVLQVAGITGSLRHAHPAGGARWQRWEAGTAIPAPAGLTGYFPDAGPHRRDLTIIAHGRNSTNAPAAIAAVDEAIVSHLGHTAYAVLDVLNSRDEPAGTAGHQTVAGINALRADLYEQHHIPVWAWVKANAQSIVEASGKTWTSTDQADLAAGCLATSLRLPGDPLHPNEIANLAAADHLYAELLDRKITEE